MKKSYKLRNLDCANCAAKMEAGIKKIEGVENAAVNFLLQKITIEAPQERIDEIMQKAAKLCRRIEPDCKIVL